MKATCDACGFKAVSIEELIAYNNHLERCLSQANHKVAGLSMLIESMQRMQATYRALSKTTPSGGADLIVSVLSDLIRLSAEVRAGDGRR